MSRSGDHVFSFLRPHEPRPVFVIGSYRSGTSALTWALGQHPNLFPLEETHFLYKLAVDLEYLFDIGTAQGEHSFLGLAGYRQRQFRGHFGRAVDDLVRDARKRIATNAREAALRDKTRINRNIKLGRGRFDPKRRWVDGTPENSHFVLPLLRVFPHARFIHILRNPRRVATSLMHFSSMGAIDYPEELAYRTWTRLARDCALAEQALGRGIVMQLLHEDLLDSPRESLQRCLAFAGEPHHEDCLKPLREKLNSSRYDDAGDCSIKANLCSPKPWIREAFELYVCIRRGMPLVPGGAAGARRALRRSFEEYADSLKPSTNESLSSDNRALRLCIEDLEFQRNELYSTVKRLEKRLYTPLQLIDWGPQEVELNTPFNPQDNGQNALWFQTKHAPGDTVVYIDDIALETAYHPGGDLITASIPPALSTSIGERAIQLRSDQYQELTPIVRWQIKPKETLDARSRHLAGA